MAVTPAIANAAYQSIANIGSDTATTSAKGALQPNELLRAFVRYKHVDYYNPVLFGRAYDWMKARGMTEGHSEHGALVVG